MDRISPRRARPLSAWAYALAVFVMAVVIGGALLWPHGERPAPEPVKRLVKAPSHVAPKLPPPVPELKHETRTVESDTARAPLAIGLRKPDHRRYVSLHHKRGVASVSTARSEQRADMPSKESSALAYVTWSIASQPSDSYQYSYTETDPVTGEVTKCRVRREGGAVEIDVESEPAQTETKPAKESKNNEANHSG